MHHPRRARIIVEAALRRQIQMWRDELAATRRQFSGWRRHRRFEVMGNRSLRFDPVAQTAAVAVCGSCLDPWKEPRTSKSEDCATGRPAGIAALFIHAKHHFLTLASTRNGTGSHSQRFPDCGFFERGSAESANFRLCGSGFGNRRKAAESLGYETLRYQLGGRRKTTSNPARPCPSLPGPKL